MIAFALALLIQDDVLRRQWDHAPTDKTGPVALTALPMKLDDVDSFIPYGLMVGEHVTPIDHAYFVPKKMKESARDAYEVFAAADGWIVSVQHRTGYLGTDAVGHKKPDEYRIVFQHSKTFWTYYDLVTSLDDEFKKATPIAVKAGQRIGRIGGQTLDFGVVDADVTLKGFVVPRHYDREPWKVHTVDPIDAFEKPLREKLLAINPRKAEPRGGKIDLDVDGRLVGNWFREKTNGYAGAGDARGYWTGHLAFAYHHVDPTKVIVSLGDFTGKTAQFCVKGNAPDPAKVSKDDGLVVYELIQMNVGWDGSTHDRADASVRGVLLVQLLDDRKLKIEVAADASVKAFTDAARTYER